MLPRPVLRLLSHIHYKNDTCPNNPCVECAYFFIHSSPINLNLKLNLRTSIFCLPFYQIVSQQSFISHSTECPGGRYGQNCSESCGRCLKSNSCNRVTGQCADSCLPGYDYVTDDTCKTSYLLF